MIVLEKWIPEKPISAIYYDGEKERYYVKRFLIENENKEEIFISEHQKSQLEIVSTDCSETSITGVSIGFDVFNSCSNAGTDSSAIFSVLEFSLFVDPQDTVKNITMDIMEKRRVNIWEFLSIFFII